MLSIKDYPSDWARRLCKEAGGRNKPQIETDLYQNYGQFDMETVSTSVIDDTGSWRGKSGYTLLPLSSLTMVVLACRKSSEQCGS